MSHHRHPRGRVPRREKSRLQDHLDAGVLRAEDEEQERQDVCGDPRCEVCGNPYLPEVTE